MKDGKNINDFEAIGKWIYNYQCNQCLSPIKCEFKSRSWRDVLYTTLCDKVVSDLQQCCRSTDNYSYCKTWPFGHKTFEREFVVILEEKKPTNTLSNKYFVLIGQLWSKIKYIHKLKIN
jgi:hypothetical protein